jgi:hypothetical protein
MSSRARRHCHAARRRLGASVRVPIMRNVPSARFRACAFTRAVMRATFAMELGPRWTERACERECSAEQSTVSEEDRGPRASVDTGLRAELEEACWGLRGDRYERTDADPNGFEHGLRSVTRAGRGRARSLSQPVATAGCPSLRRAIGLLGGVVLALATARRHDPFAVTALILLGSPGPRRQGHQCHREKSKTAQRKPPCTKSAPKGRNESTALRRTSHALLTT